MLSKKLSNFVLVYYVLLHIMEFCISLLKNFGGNSIIVMEFILMQAHPPGAVNVQIYRLIKEWTAWDITRRAAFAFFGIFAGTEENPEFLQSMVASSVHFSLITCI